MDFEVSVFSSAVDSDELMLCKSGSDVVATSESTSLSAGF